jgi:hypothetical protein
MKTNLHWMYLAQFFLEWEMSWTKVVEKIRTHISSTITFRFRKSCRLWDNVEKYCRARQVTDDNMAHAQSMLDSQGYKQTTPIACPLQQRLHERASMLRYTYTVLLTLILFWYVCRVCEQHASSMYLFLTSVLQSTSTHSKNTEIGPKLTKYFKTSNQLSEVCICKSKT